MASTLIKHYYVRWSAQTHSGYISFYDMSHVKVGQLEDADLQNPAEFQVLWDMLRKEDPIYFDPVSKRVLSGTYEPTGEED